MTVVATSVTATNGRMVILRGKPKSVPGWLVANIDGQLFSYRKRAMPGKIKRLFHPFTKPVKLSSVAGCGLPNRTSIYISGTRSDDNTVTLIIYDSVLVSETKFEIANGDMCEISQEVDSSFLLKKINETIWDNTTPVHQAQPNKVVPERPMPFNYRFWIPKQRFGGIPQPAKEAVLFYNDGHHLYIVGHDGLQHLLYRNYAKEVPSWVPGMKFSEYTVSFRTFGHTLSGNIVIMIREVNNNWTLTLSIAAKHFVAVDDLYDRIGVRNIAV